MDYTDFGNIWVTLSIFIVSALIFQILALSTYKSDLWEKTDYVWLLLLAFGIIGSTGEVRRLVNAELQYPETTYRISLNHLKRSVDHEYRYYNELVNLDGVEKNFGLERKQACIDFGVWYRTVKMNFDELYPKLLKEPSIDLIEKFRKDYLGTEKFTKYMLETDNRFSYNQLLVEFDEMMEKTSEYQKYQESFNRTSSERVLFILGPLLLAISIAMRLGKVTALIKRKTKSA
ncbi:hypothetical protein [Mangrovibacterium diazotrophicum]|uniref:Uncharacterized protein n=1 Tax=Mangrovibacterium diazotrophicum TaxID=1261403 RepID=A0A419VX76_9BACT|nr:hypothetical protein [Mangrovibacterium diazotrophicum]RKD87827.1 hypothetical protein BC643_3834 [Mangrovibacterium diazotrophicum]